MSRHADLRAGYIVIASRKFASDGYHGTSLAALAQEAGVTKQALLHFFSTKERLYAEVLTDLAERQCAEIDAIKQTDPVDQLTSYFLSVLEPSPCNSENARLVVRALLDSDEKARSWPMKPYLDRLVNLVRSTPDGSKLDDAEALAWVFQMIGAIQYVTIALPAVSGMYGKDAANTVGDGFRQFVAHHVHRLNLSDRKPT